jgi:hypothetical protein
MTCAFAFKCTMRACDGLLFLQKYSRSSHDWNSIKRKAYSKTKSCKILQVLGCVGINAAESRRIISVTSCCLV